LVGEWWCWWGVGNVERERDKEREREGMMRMGAGEREQNVRGVIFSMIIHSHSYVH